jgi:pyridoxal phosphate enzyme (YggS family)
MIEEQLALINETLPPHVCLVAVSKTKPAFIIKEAYDAGQRHFGENKVQELVEKAEELPKDIKWHLIGHLQTNKVKYLIPHVHLIHSVDSLKLLAEINKQASKLGKVVDCLMQFHIAQETSKFGLTLDEAHGLLLSDAYQQFKNIRFVGVMGMASNTDEETQIKAEFARLRYYFQELKTRFFANEPSFRELSMGMSGDYLLAIEEGSTMVRVGSSIFGSR